MPRRILITLRDTPAPHILGVDLLAQTGDAARIEVALPRDPHDPYLQDWVRVQPGPAKFGKAQMLS